MQMRGWTTVARVVLAMSVLMRSGQLPPPCPGPPAPSFPFLLVDRVVEWEYGKHAVGYK